jgi:hypothetical protein
LQVLDKVKAPATGIVSPLGESSATVSFVAPAKGLTTAVDIPMAEAVRSKEPLEVGDMETMRIRIDGLTKHSHRATVERAEEPGRFIPAEVRDPAFEQRPNAYTRALEADNEIMVHATPTYRAGVLHRLYVMGVVKE